MEKASTYMGLDVHKKQIAVALLRPESSQVVEWKLGSDPRAVRR